MDLGLVLERGIPGLLAQTSLFLMHSGSRFEEIRGTVRFFVNSCQLARICLCCLSHTRCRLPRHVARSKFSLVSKQFLPLASHSSQENNLESQRKNKKRFKIVENLESLCRSVIYCQKNIHLYLFKPL